MSVSTLERRVEALETSKAAGGDEGCDRCRGTLIAVSDAITGEFRSATCNGQPLSEEEVQERRTETRCPRCGRKLDPEEALVIKVGGQR